MILSFADKKHDGSANSEFPLDKELTSDLKTTHFSWLGRPN
jgi:hypothetical protein